MSKKPGDGWEETVRLVEGIAAVGAWSETFDIEGEVLVLSYLVGISEDERGSCTNYHDDAQTCVIGSAFGHLLVCT